MKANAAAMDRYGNVVMQGGGIRCFWQAGVLSFLSKDSGLQPRRIYSVSASAAMACAYVANRLDFSIDCFRAAVAKNRRNVYPSNLLSARSIFPHGAIYRQVLKEVFDGQHFQSLKAAVDVRVLLARPPAGLRDFLVVPLSAALYFARKIISRKLWERARVRSGFATEFVAINTCSTSGELADLVLSSSCTPPITPLYRYAGRPSIDGGLLESVPRSALRDDDAPALFLLTKTPNRPVMGREGDQVIFPSQPIPYSAWDYANPSAIDEIVDLGRRDAQRFMSKL